MIALAILLTSTLAALLWMGVVAPAILRAFGVPMVLGFRRDRRNRYLTRRQYAWGFGVFTWALGMFLFITIWNYLDLRLLGDTLSHPDAFHTIIWLLIWLASGLLFGIFTSPRRHRAI